MDELTKRFLRFEFQKYYEKAEIHAPPSLNMREWGFIQFDPMPEIIMRRHKSFGSYGEMREYLTAMAPAHCYYSVAYYAAPAAPVMNRKEWKGADLIFDLDADHLPGAKKTYSEMLEHVKSETLKLIDFLTDDFGFYENNIELVFSGGRGYHFHIYDPKVKDLGSAERREIVNYIRGRGLSVDSYLSKEAMAGDYGVGSKSFKGMKKVPEKYSIKNQDTGWGKRITKYMIEYLVKESEKDEKERFNNIQATPTEKKKLLEISKNPDALHDIEVNGRLDFFKAFDFRKFFKQIIEMAADEVGVDAGASVDEPVTGDIKRLIRAPGSLHGGTGFIAKKIKLDELENFLPLSDAFAFGKEEIPVRVGKPFSFELDFKEYDLDVGSYKIPKYAAIYLMCRGVAKYGS
ncbi:MAG: DNA primase catalytic subunit PriS [Methanosarcinaceae archaeon]|nr:DNA primase catalytic subunit PriS [Methanosarcinaceae archaeon]